MLEPFPFGFHLCSEDFDSPQADLEYSVKKVVIIAK